MDSDFNDLSYDIERYKNAPKPDPEKLKNNLIEYTKDKEGNDIRIIYYDKYFNITNKENAVNRHVEYINDKNPSNNELKM